MIQKFSLLSFLRRHLSRRGMSTLEMAVTMGLVGLGALGAASLSGNMVAGSKKIQGMVAVNNFASSLNTYLYSSMGCEDLKAMGSMSTSPQEVALTLWNYEGATRFEGGYHADGSQKTKTRNFDIASLTAYMEADPNPAQVTDAGAAPLTKGILKLKAVLKVGKKPMEYVYNVPVLMNGSTVAYCSDKKNLVETCAAAQGKYNPATNECELAKACVIKDTWNQLTCTSSRSSRPSCSMIFGPSKNNRYTGGFSCPAGSTQTITQTENWTSQRDCGKKCTENIYNQMTWAVCMECPP